MPAETLEFHASLYDADAVVSAVEAFGHLATFEVDRQEHRVLVSVSEVDERVADRLTDALCNHVLFETVARHRSQGAQP